MNKDEKRELRRKRLMDNKAYQTMNGLTRYMDRYYLDALIGIIPGWGDAIALLSVVPFVYFSSRVIKSIPLTLAVLNNALRDVLMGMIPFFVLCQAKRTSSSGRRYRLLPSSQHPEHADDSGLRSLTSKANKFERTATRPSSSK